MDVRSEYYAKIAGHIIKNMAPRNFKGIYCQNRAEALKAIAALMPEGASVGWGGSRTLQEIGFFDLVNSGKYRVFDRDKASAPEEKADVYAKIQTADFFFLSTNAVTLDGELVNIDGRSDRISFLCFGPRNVVIVAGMNKVAADVEAAIQRTHLVSAPLNAAKNGKKRLARQGASARIVSPKSASVRISWYPEDAATKTASP